jgi:hypothetical protein
MTRDDEDRRIEQEIRRQRRATLAGALAGRDGGGHLKGASPTPVIQRALLEIDHWLAAHLPDGPGSLQTVILRHLAGHPDLLEAGLGDPAGTMARWLDKLLAVPAALAELVREADMEWGSQYQERPHFERPGQDPSPDDPYTVAGVTSLLTDLRGRL